MNTASLAPDPAPHERLSRFCTHLRTAAEAKERAHLQHQHPSHRRPGVNDDDHDGSVQAAHFSAATESPEFLALIAACTPAPDLSVFDEFLGNNQSCAKLFSNPQYFMEQWRTSLQREHDERKARKQARRHSKTAISIRLPQTATQASELEVKRYNSDGEVINGNKSSVICRGSFDSDRPPQVPHSQQLPPRYPSASTPTSVSVTHTSPTAPESQITPPPPPPPPDSSPTAQTPAENINKSPIRQSMSRTIAIPSLSPPPSLSLLWPTMPASQPPPPPPLPPPMTPRTSTTVRESADTLSSPPIIESPTKSVSPPPAPATIQPSAEQQQPQQQQQIQIIQEPPRSLSPPPPSSSSSSSLHSALLEEVARRRAAASGTSAIARLEMSKSGGRWNPAPMIISDASPSASLIQRSSFECNNGSGSQLHQETFDEQSSSGFVEAPSGFLKEIRMGQFRLRKVGMPGVGVNGGSHGSKKKFSNRHEDGVAAILMRRRAMEMSDSDDSDSEGNPDWE